MSDQGKWFKLWVTALSDLDLENMALHEWAQWVRLGVFLKAHGTRGKLVISPPARALQNALRVPTYEDLIRLLKRLPNYALFSASQGPSETPSQAVDKDQNKYLLVCENWNKYQGDQSKERMKKNRERNTVTSTVTSDGKSDGLRREEKRRDLTSTSTSTSLPTPTLALGARATASQTGKEPDPEPERMNPEEMKAIRKRNLGVMSHE